MLAHLPTIFVLATLVLIHLKFFLSADRHTKQKKKACQSEDPVGKGSTMLPTVLGKMADFGERKENCSFSVLAA